MHPAITTLKDFYDNWSEGYSEKITVQAQYSIPSWLKENEPLLAPGKKAALDLGYADGFIGKEICQLRPNYSFDGVDLSPKMVEACKKVYASCICSDLDQGLPKEVLAKSYDIVFATSCLEFIQNHKERFQEIAKVLQPNGQFWLTVEKAEPDSIKEVFGVKKVFYSSPKEIETLLQETGFAVTSIELKAAYFSNHHAETTKYFCIIAKKIS